MGLGSVSPYCEPVHELSGRKFEESLGQTLFVENGTDRISRQPARVSRCRLRLDRLPCGAAEVGDVFLGGDNAPAEPLLHVFLDLGDFPVTIVLLRDTNQCPTFAIVAHQTDVCVCVCVTLCVCHCVCVYECTRDVNYRLRFLSILLLMEIPVRPFTPAKASSTASTFGSSISF